MASFEKYIPTESENYLGYSKGVEGPKPNMSLAKLFSGVGEFADAAIKGTEQYADLNIKNIAQDQSRELNSDVSGLTPEDAATLGRFKNKVDKGDLSLMGGPSGSPGSPLVSSAHGGATLVANDTQNAPTPPPEVSKGLATLNKYHQMYLNGELSPTYWMTKQQVVTQQLKQRFPGWEDKIDSEIHQGTQSANELRRQIFSDFQSAATAANTSQKDYVHFVNQNADILGGAGLQAALQPSFLNDFNKQKQVYAAVAEQKSITYKRDQGQKDAEAKLAENKWSTVDAENKFITSVDSVVAGAFKGMYSPLTGLTEKINDQLTKGVPDDKFLMAATNTLNQVQQGVEAQIDSMERDPTHRINDPAKIALIRKNALAPFERIRTALGTGNVTMANFHAEFAKRMNERNTLQILKLSSAARVIAALKPIGDQNLATQLIQAGEGGFANFWKTTHDIMVANSMGNNDPEASINDVSKPHQDAPGTDKHPPANVIVEGMNKLKTIINSPEASTEAKANTVEYITKDAGGQFFKNFKDADSRVKAFSILTTPDVSKSVHDLNPTEWSNYKSWSQRMLNAQVSSIAGDLQVLAGHKDLGFTYNTENGQLVWNERGRDNPNAEGFFQNRNGRIEVPYPQLQRAISVNNALRNIHEMYNLDNTDANTNIIPLMKSIGVSVMNPVVPAKKATDEKSNQAIPFAATPKTPEALQAINNALRQNLEPGKDERHITNLSPELKTGLAAMLKDAPEGVEIFSGHRSEARQRELFDAAVKKYGSVEAARKWVAPPGHSMHGTGNAADLRFASAETRNWVHENAKRYGLHFPLSNEPWHIEPVGARQ